MKVYSVIDHEDQYETGTLVIVTSNKEEAERVEDNCIKKGMSPVLQEWEV